MIDRSCKCRVNVGRRFTSDRGRESAPGTSVVEAAQRHDVHRSLLTVWRRQARAGVLACGSEPVQRQDDGVRFAAVSIAPDRQPLTAPSGTSAAIEIEFAAEARMRITGAVDAATLTALVAALQRQCQAPFQSPLATIGLRIVDIPCRGSTTSCWIGSICPLVCRRVRLERLLPLC